MKGLKRTLMFLASVLFLTGAASDNGFADNHDRWFPSYGTGAVEVRLYTDYFCPPCQAMEPQVEPLLKELLKKNKIRLILVDVPIHKLSPLFSRNFLYAFKANQNLEQVFRIRNVLQNAAIRKEVVTQARVEELFRKTGIAWSFWNPQPTFDRYNELMNEDNINATPSCVIIQNGTKNTIVGDADIVNALKSLL